MLLGWTTIGAYGAVCYSFGVLLQPIRDATGWSTSALTAGFSMSVLVGGVGAVLAGRGLDRIGARPVLVVSLAVGCAGLLAASYATETWQFIAAWAIGAGAVASGLYYHVTMAVTARLFPEQRAAVFSVLTLLGALAGPIFYPLAGWLVESVDWRPRCGCWCSPSRRAPSPRCCSCVRHQASPSRRTMDEQAALVRCDPRSDNVVSFSLLQ